MTAWLAASSCGVGPRKDIVLRSMSYWLALAIQPVGQVLGRRRDVPGLLLAARVGGDEHPPGGEAEGDQRHDEGDGREDAGRACRRGGLVGGE